MLKKSQLEVGLLYPAILRTSLRHLWGWFSADELRGWNHSVIDDNVEPQLEGESLGRSRTIASIDGFDVMKLRIIDCQAIMLWWL